MPKIAIGADIVNDFEKGLQKEWITTNGMGGFASSTILGCNTRRYHGLLTVARPEDSQRMVLLSKLEEMIKIGHKYFYLSTNKYTENYIHPTGYLHLRKFEQVPFPRFIFTVADITMVKEIFMIRETNTAVIRYRLFGGGGSRFSFVIHPLLAYKNFHMLQRENRYFSTETIINGSTITLKPYENMPHLTMRAENMEYKDLKSWYKNFQYERERDRGLNYIEDLFNPGYFIIQDVKEFEVDFIATCDDTLPEDTDKAYKDARTRIDSLFDLAGSTDADPDEKSLVLACDQHLVKRNLPGREPVTTIVAGYHWFEDWGRDSFISLPGLALCTGRHEEAKHILEAFAAGCRNGIIPNRFINLGTEPEYNTVDASLWFINAVNEYLKATNDTKFIKTIYKTCKSIIENYEKGTDFGIRMDKDGLIYAGEDGVQLTWMDAKIDDHVITPRAGKPVEVNALWYNALCIMSEFALKLKENDLSAHYKELAEKVYESFNKKYWYQRGGYLYDVIGNSQPDVSFRPNQLYAISLPYPALDRSRWKAIVEEAQEKLYTPFGVRTLDPDNPNYRGIHTGREADLSYHMGTAWGFLLGAFIEAYLKANDYSPAAAKKAEIMHDLWMGDLSNAGLNTLSEIYDGDEPFSPKGCISQAWSVAEALRIRKILNEIIK